MSEHEPECWIASHANPLNGCICTELRACEKRVRREERIRAAGIVMDTREAWRDPDMAWTLIERIKAKP